MSRKTSEGTWENGEGLNGAEEEPSLSDEDAIDEARCVAGSSSSVSSRILDRRGGIEDESEREDTLDEERPDELLESIDECIVRVSSGSIVASCDADIAEEDALDEEALSEPETEG